MYHPDGVQRVFVFAFVFVVMKLLVADRHPTMREFLKTLLSPIAEELIECADAEGAVAAYAAARPDWAVLDLHMRPISGLAALREIRQGFPDARIIITTELDHAGLRDVVLQAGAHAFLLKENLHELPLLLATTRSRESGPAIVLEEKGHEKDALAGTVSEITE